MQNLNMDVPTTLFIQGVPHRGPNAPNIAVRQHMMPYVSSMHWHLIYDLQRYCNYDPARKMLFYNASQSQYMNPYYAEELLGKAMEYLEFKMYAESMPYMQAIPAVSNDICGMEASKFAINNPGIRAMLTQELLNDYSAWDNLGKQIGARVYTYTTQTQQHQPQMMMGANMVQPGYGIPVQGGARGYGGSNYGVPINSMGYSQPAPMANMYGGAPAGNMAFGGFAIPQQVPTMHPHAGTRREDPLLSSVNRSGIPVQVEQPQQQPPQQTQAPSIRREPVIQEFHMDGDSLVSATTLIPAHGSDKRITNVPRDNYNCLYDPMTEVAFFEVDGDIVREIIQPKDPSMNYEEHETIHFLKPKTQADADHKKEYALAKDAFMNVVQQKSIDVRLKEHEKFTANVEMADGEPILIQEPFFLEEEIIGLAETTDNVLLDMDSYFTEHDIPADRDEAVISCTYIKIDRVRFIGTDAIKIAELMSSTTWGVLRERMVALRDIMRPLYWNRIHDDLTAAVNEYLRYVLNVRPQIESFVDDIDELPGYLTKKVGVIYGDRLESAARDIAASVCTTFNNQDEIFKQVHGELENDDFCVCRGRIDSITLLPIHSRDLVMQYEGVVGRVRSDGKYNDFYNAIKVIFDRQRGMPVRPRHTKLITEDGEEIYLYRAAFGQDEFLVRKGR